MRVVTVLAQSGPSERVLSQFWLSLGWKRAKVMDWKRISLLESARRWWAVRDLNPRHPACKAGALTN